MPRRCSLLCALLLAACDKTTPPEKPAVAPHPKESTPRVATPSAPAAPKKKPTPDELRKYRAALKKGQTLESKGDHAGAIVAFQEALAVLPDEPQALDELGVAAFRNNDLAVAERMAQRAAQLTADGNQRGRALYNLGRVQEQRGEMPKAIASYRGSLENRPNKIVRERLAKLDPAAAAEKDSLATRPMEGPFASLQAWCDQAQQKKECTNRDDEDDDKGDDKDDDDDDTDSEKADFSCDQKTVTLAGPPAPMRAVQAVSARCDFHDHGDLVMADHGLAVRVGDQWYVAVIGNSLSSFRNEQTLEVNRLEARALAPGGPVRVLAYISGGSAYRGMDATTRDSLAIVGIGPSGKPSIARGILMSTQHDEDDPETGDTKASHGGQLKLDFLPGETLEITRPTKNIGNGIDKETLAPLLGKHLLAFP